MIIDDQGVAAMQVDIAAGPKPARSRSRSGLNDRQLAFCRIVAKGSSYAAAYRQIYNSSATTAQSVQSAKRLVQRPGVRAEICRIRAMAEKKTILTINDQLSILASNAQVRGNSPALVNARTRAIDVYAKIAGTVAPQRVELAGPGGAPISTATTALIGAMSPREKAKLLREQHTISKSTEIVIAAAPTGPAVPTAPTP